MAPDPDADAAPAVAPSNNASAMPETPSETCIASLCNVSVSPNAEACLKDNSTCFCDSGWFTDVSARADLVNPYYCNRTVVEMVPGLWFALFSVLALMFAVLGYRSARKLVAIKTGCLDTPREKQIAAARRKVHGIKRRIEWTLVNRIHLYLIIWGFTQAVVCFLNDAYHSLAAKMALRLLQSVTWGIGSTSYLSVASFWYKVASFRCKQEVGRTNCIRRTFNGIQVCVWVAIFYNVMIDILKIAGALVDDTLARAAFNASLSLIFLTITLTIWVAYCQLRRQLTAGVNDMDEESRLDFAYKFNRLTRPVLVGSFWGVVAVCWGVLIAVMMLPARKHWTLVYYDPSFHTVAVFMPAFLEWFLYLALQNAVFVKEATADPNKPRSKPRVIKRAENPAPKKGSAGKGAGGSGGKGAAGSGGRGGGVAAAAAGARTDQAKLPISARHKGGAGRTSPNGPPGGGHAANNNAAANPYRFQTGLRAEIPPPPPDLPAAAAAAPRAGFPGIKRSSSRAKGYAMQHDEADIQLVVDPGDRRGGAGRGGTGGAAGAATQEVVEVLQHLIIQALTMHAGQSQRGRDEWEFSVCAAAVALEKDLGAELPCRDSLVQFLLGIKLPKDFAADPDDDVFVSRCVQMYIEEQQQSLPRVSL